MTETKRDPKFTYTPQQYVLSYGETGLYLSVIGDAITGVAPVNWVKVFFEYVEFLLFLILLTTSATRQERLPYNEGWRRPATQTNLLTLGAMVLELVAANGDALPEGLEITTNTLKLAFGGYNPLTVRPQ